LGEALLALHRKACAATASNVVSLDAHILEFVGLAAVVRRVGPALQIRARQIALGELLSWITHPARAADGERLYAARADRFISSLQYGLRSNLVRVGLALLLCHRRRNHCRGCEKQHPKS